MYGRAEWEQTPANLLVCMPCEKGNHHWCMGEVVNIATGNMVPCECAHCEEQQIRSEQTYREDQQKW